MRLSTDGKLLTLFLVDYSSLYLFSVFSAMCLKIENYRTSICKNLSPYPSILMRWKGQPNRHILNDIFYPQYVVSLNIAFQLLPKVVKKKEEKFSLCKQS